MTGLPVSLRGQGSPTQASTGMTEAVPVVDAAQYVQFASVLYRMTLPHTEQMVRELAAAGGWQTLSWHGGRHAEFASVWPHMRAHRFRGRVQP